MAKKSGAKRLGGKFSEFAQMSRENKQRALYTLLLIIAAAVIFIAVRVPAFLSLSSIINVVSLTAAKLPIALGVGGCIVLSGTDISAGRVVGLTACIAAALLQATDYVNKLFPNLETVPVWAAFLAAL